VFGTDLDMDAVEFCDDLSQAERRQVLQCAPLLPAPEAVMAEYPFNGSLMKLEVELFEDLLGDGCAGQIEFGSLVDDVTDELRGDLVGLFLPPGFVHQAGEAFSAKALQGLIESFPRVPELTTDPSDETSLMAMSAQHLVLDLAAIVWFEEVGLLKQMRLDGFLGMFHGGPLKNMVSSITFHQKCQQ
jgi:hypothetical protein